MFTSLFINLRASLGASLLNLDINSTTKHVPLGICPFSAALSNKDNAPYLLFLPLPDTPRSLNLNPFEFL